MTMTNSPFFGQNTAVQPANQNLSGQEQWQRRNENENRIRSLENSRTADEATLALISTGAWTTFTSSITQSGAVTFTTTYGRYTRIGRAIHAQVDLAVTGTGTAGQEVVVGLPVAAVVSTGNIIGVGLIYDSSASIAYQGIAQVSTATTIRLWPMADGAPALLGARAFTAALASGDVVRYAVTYEAAA